MSRPSLISLNLILKLGKPVNIPSDIDHVPSVFAYKVQNRSATSEKQTMERAKRLDKKRKTADAREREEADSNLAAEGLLMLSNAQTKHDAANQTETPTAVSETTQTMNSSQSVSIQTDLSGDLPVQSVLVPYCVPASHTTPLSLIKNSDEATNFYTGLPSWSSFQFVVNFIYEEKYDSKLSKLSPAEGLMLTLMRLRLNLTISDLSYRFHVSITTVRTVFSKWIEDLFVNFKCLIKWPTQDIARKNLPAVFADLFPNTRCIIDCSEVFIERPYGYLARKKTYSNYKKHNTIKFLIAVTPCGSICFLSKCWGGRASDRCITMNSGFLDLLSSGDTVLADRGFTISDDLALFGAKLEIPSFTTGKKQLSLQEVECSKRLSKVRIHVERIIIGLLKNKYTILQGKRPVTLLKRKDDSDFAFIDSVNCVLRID